MDFQTRKNKIINYIKVFSRITSGDVQKIAAIHRNTALRDLRQLVEQGVLQAVGEGKGTHYQLVSLSAFDQQGFKNIWTKKQQAALHSYLKRQNRKPVFFNQTKDKALSAPFSVPVPFDEKVAELAARVDEVKKQLSVHEQKRKKQRLVIDLSWASSHIEGNTYSLLETESLIEHLETAHGKKYTEAKMILNHKEAIEYIREYKVYQELSRTKIFELHQMLIEGLEVETGLRKHLVRISNSSYVPSDNEFQIVQTLDEIILAINKTPSVLQKAIMANLLIAYLQPFADGNKRTARMLGNAILVSQGLLPISFSHTPKDDYIKSILYFYEKQDPNYFIFLFFKELNTSFIEYIG